MLRSGSANHLFVNLLLLGDRQLLLDYMSTCRLGLNLSRQLAAGKANKQI